VKILFLIILLLFSFNVIAKSKGSVTGLELPRFVSLKSDESNLRNGPSKNYPIKLTYKVKNLPLMVVDEYELWRKVTDFEKNEGWVKKNLIKSDRYGIIKTNYDEGAQILNKPKGEVIGKIGNRNIVKVIKCLKDWCLIEIQKNKGWIIKTNIWGVFDEEIFNIPFYQPIINQFWKINF